MCPPIISRSDSLSFSRFRRRLQTVDGKEYKSAKITRVEPDGIVLMNTVGHGG